MSDIVISIGKTYHNGLGEQRRVTNYNGYVVAFRAVRLDGELASDTEEVETPLFREWAKDQIS